MNKDELLNEIRYQAAQNKVTVNELCDAFRDGLVVQGTPDASKYQPQTSSTATAGNDLASRDRAEDRRAKLSEALYYIGGGIVFLGIAFMIGQNWLYFNDFMRIFVTLGFGLVFYVIAVYLERYSTQSNLSLAFFLLSGLVMPLGLAVTLYIMGRDVGSYGTQTFIAAIMTGIFAATFYFFRKDSIQVLLIVFATWLYFALTGLITDGNDYFGMNYLYYRSLLLGASFLSLGYYYFRKNLYSIRATLFGAGSLLVLTSTFGLIHWEEDPVSVLWLLFYPIVIAAAIYFSIYLKSKVMLIVGAISIIVYITTLNGKFFAESLGFPFVLMVSGLLIVGVGYFVFYLNQHYFGKEAGNLTI